MNNSLSSLCASLINGQLAKQNFILQPKTKLNIACLNILWDEGFILGYKMCSININTKLLKIFLKYKNESPTINVCKLLSKPSSKKYYSVLQLWKLNSKKNLIIFSTSKGLMSITECQKKKTGGKPLIIIG